MTELIFWQTLAELAERSEISIDRPRGSPHPRYPDLIFPLDYGYLEGTSSADGGGIDVWLGSLGTRLLSGILCTYDTGKRDAEIKLVLGATDPDVQAILSFNARFMRYLYLPRPQE
jgi:inorganic pyrophosphatase